MSTHRKLKGYETLRLGDERRRTGMPEWVAVDDDLIIGKTVSEAKAIYGKAAFSDRFGMMQFRRTIEKKGQS